MAVYKSMASNSGSGWIGVEAWHEMSLEKMSMDKWQKIIIERLI